MGPSQHELFLLTCCHYDLITPTRTNTTSVTYLYCHLGHEDGSEYVVGQLEENALLQTGRAEEARISKGLKLAPLFSGFLHVCRTDCWFVSTSSCLDCTCILTSNSVALPALNTRLFMYSYCHLVCLYSPGDSDSNKHSQRQ